MQRILLFLMTNIAILVVVSFVFNIISANTGLTVQNPLGLLILCGLFGLVVPSYHCLFRWMAVGATGAVIEQPRTPAEHWLVETVKQQTKTGIPCHKSLSSSPRLMVPGVGVSQLLWWLSVPGCLNR